MTFSVIARCPRTGMFGIAIATRPMAIGAKCPFLRPGIGGLVVQANGDPRLGPLGLSLLEQGYSARKVLNDIIESDGEDNIAWRQIAVIDKDGRTAAVTGKDNEDWKGHVAKQDYAVLGNRLTSEHTLTAMSEAFERHGDLELADRLVCVLEAARDAGGQVAGQHSAALLVHNRKSYAWVDLRVDVNRTGDRGGFLVKVKQVPQSALQVADSIALRPQRAECRRWIRAGVGG